LELLVFLGIGVHGLTLRVRVLHFSLESADHKKVRVKGWMCDRKQFHAAKLTTNLLPYRKCR